MTVDLRSEFGRLECVVVHTPGPEVESMSPSYASRALYSDILNLTIARREYDAFRGTLARVSRVVELEDLLRESLQHAQARKELLDALCPADYPGLREELDALDASHLSKLMLEGVPRPQQRLQDFLSEDRYIIPPLYNFYFMRDAAMCVGDCVLLGKMASRVRLGETKIMETILRYSDTLRADVLRPWEAPNPENVRIEGGDVHVAREDILLIGNGARTTPGGVDFLISQLVKRGLKKKLHVLVQELPLQPESFIHLDMVFTLLGPEDCMVYEPVIRGNSTLRTIHIEVEPNGKTQIRYCRDLVYELNALGLNVKPIVCGGVADPWHQEREQWHSGANFVAFAPGKVLGYARNRYTVDELAARGFEVLRAEEVASGEKNPRDVKKCVVVLDGSELPRGGGGCRCMTFPVRRSAL